MRPEAENPEPTHGDARDVVTGPVGDARLVEPSTAEALSADLDRLTPIDDPFDADLERVTPIDDVEPAMPETPTGLATPR